MKSKWLLVFTISISIIALSGCGKTVEEQINSGVASAQTIFEENPQNPNKTVGDIELYVPSSYSIEKTEDKNNFLLKKGKDQFILFVNNNEKEDSKLQYQLLKNDKTKRIVKEQKVEVDDAFGFTAVVEYDKEHFELIVSSGRAKISTISKEKNIDEKLEDMMQIARSVKIIKK